MKKAWNNTVKSLGQYIDINSVKEEDKSFRGIFLSYATIEKANTLEDDKNLAYNEVPFSVGEYKLDVILTVPKGVDNPIVVLMIQGSGPSNYNEEANGKAPFKDIAIGLAESGIATLRFNKRFYQFPSLYSQKSTINDEILEDVNAAIKQLKEYQSIKFDKIFILGYSLGAMLGPKIAYDNRDVGGFISMADSSRKLEDIIVD